MARLPTAGKTLAVILALLLAGAATFAIFTYVQGIEQRAFEDAELVDVLVAQDTIPAGLTAEAASEAGLIDSSTAPRVNVPEGALTSLDEVAGLVTEDRILAEEIIVRGRWVDPAETTGAFEIPEGFEAISVAVDVPPGVAGFVRAGDSVSLIATVQDPGDTVTDEEGTVTEEAGEVRSQYLLQNMSVLAVGQRVTTEEDEDGVQESAAQVLLTLALEPEDAERLVFAINNAGLYFTLLPEDAEPVETPGRTLADLFE